MQYYVVPLLCGTAKAQCRGSTNERYDIPIRYLLAPSCAGGQNRQVLTLFCGECLGWAWRGLGFQMCPILPQCQQRGTLWIGTDRTCSTQFFSCQALRASSSMPYRRLRFLTGCDVAWSIKRSWTILGNWPFPIRSLVAAF